MTRLLNLKSVHNFRDFGDYPSTLGGTVSPRLLFRSAHLGNLSADESEVVANLDIGLVVDLRHAPERIRTPNKLPEGQTPIVFEYPDPPDSDSEKIAPHEMFMRNDLSKAQDARDYMNLSYSNRPSDPGFRDIFAATLRHMAENGGPILIHCAAGKDRTGTLAAIILGALGVDSDTIMQDFMLTMTAVDIDSFLEPAAKIMEKRFGREYDPEALRPMFGVEPEYLERALNTIGNMDDYISNILGITDNEMTQIKRNYLIA